MLTLESIRIDIASLIGQESESVGDETDLVTTGLSSIDVMKLASRWTHAGAPVKFSELIQRRTLRDWWSLIAERATNRRAAPPVVESPVDGSSAFPLAPLQLAYWIGRQPDAPFPSGSHFYCELDGIGVDVDRLRVALQRIVDRHGMLRVRVLDDSRQQIGSRGRCEVVVHELADLGTVERERELARLRDHNSNRQLRVDEGETILVEVSRLPDARTRTHIAIDMIAADAASFRLLIDELARCYADPNTDLPIIPYSFPRYLVDRAVDGSARDRDRAYWLQRIDRLPLGPQLPFTTDASGTSHRIARREHTLSPVQWQQLNAKARSEGLTTAMVLATAFTEVLGRWSESSRMLVTLPLFDRDPLHAAVDSLVGDFTSSILLEVDASVGSSFAERARAIQNRFRDDAAHARFSGIDVARELVQRRGGSVVSPVVFTSALGLGDLFGPGVRSQLGELSWMISRTAQVWLDHQVTEIAGNLLLNWDVAIDRFEPGVVDAMFDAYVALVTWLLDPGSSWSDPAPLPLPAHQLEIRLRANRTARVDKLLLHAEFFDGAATRADSPAVLTSSGRSLTHGELAIRARRIAGGLVALGVAPGEVIAVSAARGPAQIEAVLGILAAGAAYLPVSPDQPEQRRRRILADAGVRIMIVDDRASIVDSCGVRVPSIDELQTHEPIDVIFGSPNQLAYVLYTSGSTGEPKGVEVSHAAAASSIAGLDATFELEADDITIALSALEFDLSVFDIFGPLSVGGAVALLSDRDRRDPEAWVEIARRHRVTIWNSVPSLLEAALDVARPGTLETLRWCLIGGDWIVPELPGRLFDAVPTCRFAGLGGTTETVIHSTLQVVTKVPAGWRAIPYGVPLPNVRCRIVDGSQRDCPDWVDGELWIGGAAVARGYRNRADLTAERFVVVDGTRWYRTGDRARFWSDGTIELRGRIDRQIKLRGYRIEPGEVEAAACSHPEVTRACALLLDTPTRHLALVVVGNPSAITPDEIRTAVVRCVPDHMVPERIAIIERLPLTLNGKVDYAELRNTFTSRPRSDPAPTTAAEQLVVAVWTEVLGTDHIGLDDRFFALGGDSLSAMKVIARLRARGCAVQLGSLLESPTARRFAASLALPDDAARPTTMIVPDLDRRHEPFPLTDVQRAYLIGRREELGLGGIGSHWYWEFEAVDVDIPRLEAAWNSIIRRHEMLRAIFDERGEQRILRDVPQYRIEVAHARSADEVATFSEQMSTRVSDVSRWPLFEVRAVCYRERTRIGFSFDYIAVDALSITQLFHELAQLYRTSDAELPPIDISFRDYVLNATPSAEELAAARSYWDTRVAELPPAPQLPLAVDPQRVRKPRFVRRELRLNARELSQLRARARAFDVTPSTVLATAFAEVVSRWSTQADFTLTFTLFGRREVHPDVRRVAGDFTSLLLVPYRQQDRWIETARSLQAEVWSGMEHGAVSGIEVMRELARRVGSTLPTIPIVFTSTLGVADELVELSLPFGDYVGGLSQTPQVWLDNQVIEYRGELLVNWDAVDELFPPGLLDVMFAAYRSRLHWLCDATSDWSLGAPDLLPSDQSDSRRRARSEAPPLRRRLHDAFFEVAHRDPERVALICAARSVSYGELASRARQIGGALRARGAQPHDVVAISLPRGVDQIAAVLGTLAVGAAYLPLGIELPASRRDKITTAAGVVDLIDEAWPGWQTTARDPFSAADIEPDALAYVIYTSGSTGEPKGVEIEHRAALNTIADVNRRFEVTERDRALAISALDFDLSVWDIFGTFAAGAALVVLEEHERRDARAWIDRMRRAGVTIWNSVPAVLEMLVTAAESMGLPSTLRLAMLSGDWIKLDQPARLRRFSPACEVVALGGATEASIWSNYHVIGDALPGWTSIPYGRPLANQQFRVVDASGRDCPDWGCGELWIGGAGVARGYRRDPTATHERFVHHDGHHWYRTGDLGRYRPGGTLEFLGRVDHQIKIRGHRIEPGEVEAALRVHLAVSGAAVVATPDRRGLGACVTVREPVAPTALQRAVASLLPGYMVPDPIVVVDALPLSANGKIDRLAITARLQQASKERSTDCALPVEPTEARIASLWQEVLGVETIGRYDGFFAIGGDSLQATRIVELLRRRFGIDVTLRHLLEAPTVAELARVVALAGDFAIEEGVL